MNTQYKAIPKDAIKALESGRKIEAIKITRAETGMHLKESKEAVEIYIASVPSLSEKFKTRNSLPLFLLALAILIIGLYATGILG